MGFGGRRVGGCRRHCTCRCHRRGPGGSAADGVPNHQQGSAHARLQAFRDDSTQWIVSVGMVSEGVDIPRLQVCCYLSRPGPSSLPDRC